MYRNMLLRRSIRRKTKIRNVVSFLFILSIFSVVAVMLVAISMSTYIDDGSLLTLTSSSLSLSSMSSGYLITEKKTNKSYMKSSQQNKIQKDNDEIPHNENNIYMVFSTSCDPYQNWQSIAFFHTAYRIKQPGTITRIVSGCTTAKQIQTIQKQHQERVIETLASVSSNNTTSSLSSKYQLHITPNFGHGSAIQKYWNKPHGLMHWMKNVLGYNSSSSKKNRHDNDVILLLDPDMILLKPITGDFYDYIGGWKDDELDDQQNKPLTHIQVQRGKPIAQKYAYGSQWIRKLQGNLNNVVGNNSPALNVSLSDAKMYYPAGPPYIATAKDMYQLVTYWIQFLPQVYTYYSHFMAEMFAYSIAAAHLQLPHRLGNGFMISDIRPKAHEYFDFVDLNLSRNNSCALAAASYTTKSTISSKYREALLTKQQQRQLPYAIHYCQEYAIGRWIFNKYLFPENFFDCQSPMLHEPPFNVAAIYDWYTLPNEVETMDYSSPEMYKNIVRSTWIMCTLIFTFNDIATTIKQQYCWKHDVQPNWNKTYHFHDQNKFQAMLDDPTNPFKKQ